MNQQPWTLVREVEDFWRCDVGVYPLWDDPWNLGKCGFRTIEFMAWGGPGVAAAVGANHKIITDGHNGFLASSPEEWVEKLVQLLLHTELRQRIGMAGRRTAEARCSLAANAHILIGALRDVLARPSSDQCLQFPRAVVRQPGRTRCTAP